MNRLPFLLLFVLINGRGCIENLHPVSNRSQVSFLPGLNLTQVGNNSANSVLMKNSFESSVAEKDSDFRPSEHLGAIESEEIPSSTVGNRIKFPLASVSSLSSKPTISRRKIVPYDPPVKEPVQPSAKQRIKFIYDYQRKQSNHQPKEPQPEGNDNSYQQVQGEGFMIVHPPESIPEDVHSNQSIQDISSHKDDKKNQEVQVNQEIQFVVSETPTSEEENHQEVPKGPEVSYHQVYPDSDERHPNLNNFNHHYHYSLPESSSLDVTYPKQTQYSAGDPTAYQYQYQYVVPESGGLEKPDIHPYYHQFYQQNPVHGHPEVLIDKPEAVVYLTSHRETSFTRTRKFPYKYYHPQEQQTEVHFPEHHEYAVAPQHKRISPWNKIIHLIGAFLPLGLLIAALKPPNVVKIDGNTSQPNIVLSKLRAIHLPVEHKTSLESYDEEQEEEDYKENNKKYKYHDYEYNNTCEDKSICEIILRGADKNTDLLSSLLWNLTIKSTEEAKSNELEEIVAAVKKKDCSFIRC